MRALFSLVGLLVVVAVVMWIGKSQLHALAPSSGASTQAGPAAHPPARAVQQQVLQDVQQSLQQGAERAADAKP